MDYEGPNKPSSNIMSINWNRDDNNEQKITQLHKLQNFQIETYKTLTEKIFSENGTPYIFLHSNLTNRPLKMLLDTGATISILGNDAIDFKSKFVRDTRITIFGIGGRKRGTQTHGMIDTIFTINGCKIQTSLHIIESDCLPSADGILGFDFLQQYKAKYDVEGGLIQFKLKDILMKKFTTMEGDQTNENNSPNLNTFDLEKNNLQSIMNNYDFLRGSTMNDGNPAMENTTINNECFDLNGGFLEDNIYGEYNDSVQTYEKMMGDLDKFKAQRIELNIVDSNGINAGTIVPPIQSVAFGGDLMRNDSPDLLRHDIIYKTLNLKSCSEEEKRYIRQICIQFPKQFYLEGDILGKTDIIHHSIKLLPDAKTVHTRQYRIPHAHKQILQEIIRDYERQGIIEKCSSPYNSPAMIVGKRDENDEKSKTDFRFVVDYKKLNETCETFLFPIPLIDDILDGLSGCKIFTTLDIKGAFHQITMDEGSRNYTAFTANNFQYRWIRMPMGLASAPLTWQRAINTILSGLIGNGVFVYLDDIIICAENSDKHNEILFQVMSRLENHDLQLKISKCNFYAKEFKYLGIK